MSISFKNKKKPFQPQTFEHYLYIAILSVHAYPRNWTHDLGGSSAVLFCFSYFITVWIVFHLSISVHWWWCPSGPISQSPPYGFHFMFVGGMCFRIWVKVEALKNEQWTVLEYSYVTLVKKNIYCLFFLRKCLCGTYQHHSQKLNV